MSNSPQLLSEFDLRGLTLKNRVVLAPMTRARAGEERLPNDEMAEYYAQRSSAGLLLSEATSISEQALGWVQSPGIYTDAQTEAWKKVTKAVHDKGSHIFCQLWHCGRASHSAFRKDKSRGVAPTPIAIDEEYIHTPEGKLPHETPRELKTPEIPLIVGDYQAAARRAKEAGFDGIEIHAANGYLLDQFLQSKTNQRTDRYGGSIENRFRFLKEVVESCMKVWPAERIGVRLAPNGAFNDMGSPDYRETFVYTAMHLDAYSLAYLHIMDGLAFGFHELGEPMTMADFRTHFSGPLMANCGYTQAEAETRIADGHTDMVSFGRPFISNPDLVERFANGWPLADEAPMDVWYSHDEKGYADWPRYEAAA